MSDWNDWSAALDQMDDPDLGLLVLMVVQEIARRTIQGEGLLTDLGDPG